VRKKRGGEERWCSSLGFAKRKRKEREKRYYAFDTHKSSCWYKVWKILRQGERRR
jgi:hypothetical protein